VKQPLKADIENVKEAYRRYSCFEGKEQGKMVMLAFPGQLNKGRYSDFLFTPYSKPEKGILNWYNAKPALIDIFKSIQQNGITADYDGLHRENEEHLIDLIIRKITINTLSNINECVVCFD